MTENQILLSMLVYGVGIIITVAIESVFNYRHIRWDSKEQDDFPFISCIVYPIYWVCIFYRAGWGKLPKIYYGIPITLVEIIAKKLFRRKIYRTKDIAYDTCYYCADLRDCCRRGECVRVWGERRVPHIVTETIEI